MLTQSGRSGSRRKDGSVRNRARILVHFLAEGWSESDLGQILVRDRRGVVSKLNFRCFEGQSRVRHKLVTEA